MEGIMSDEQTTVENYIEKCPQNVKEIFLKIREIVKSVAPNSEELMKWDMPSYYVDGHKIMVVGASKNHLGIYGVKPETFKDKLEKYKYTKGCIQFQYKEPVPYDLIKEIVEHQINQPHRRADGV
jgi:uncharacterized protein YdhG (YjbR/CyaY superfamily)